MLALTPSVQSPAAYDRQNLTAAQVGARLAAGANALLRANLAAAMQDAAYLHNIHPLETADGLTEADLRFGFPPGNVLRYGENTVPGTTDMTQAFERARCMSRVRVPAGTYSVDGLEFVSGMHLIGDGIETTLIKQRAAATPALLIECDDSTGHFVGNVIDGIKVQGHASASVEAVRFSAIETAALWRGAFRFAVSESYQAVTAFGTGTNIFNCYFEVWSEKTETDAFTINSGTYNTFRLFLTECGNLSGSNDGDSVAFVHGGINDIVEVVTDGQIKSQGLNTLFVMPTVENLAGADLPAGEAVIHLTGTNQVLHAPTVIFPLASADKADFAFRPSVGATFINPNVLNVGTSDLANPFATCGGAYWTLIGGRSDCTNKIDTIYDESDNDHTLRRVSMIGDVSALVAQSPTRGGLIHQHSAPNAPFSLDVKANTDVVLLDPTGTMATAQFNLIYGLEDGRAVTISTTQALTAVSWVSSAGTANLPATLAAGATLRIVYRAADNKFYRA